MKVLLIGPFPPPYGGMAVQIQKWQRSLVEQYCCECMVLNIGESRKETFDGCESVDSYTDFVRKLCAFGRRGYIFHLVTTGHSFKSWLSGLVCCLASVTNGFRSVLVFGSGDAPAYLLKKCNLFVIALIRLTIKLAGRIICRNNEMHGALIKMGANPAKLSIVPGFLGIESSAELPLPRDIQQFMESHNPLIGATVYVPKAGTLYPEYGLDLIIAALRHLKEQYPRIGVVIIGPENEAKGQIVGAEEFSEHIHFTGPLSHDLVLSAMVKLTIFTRPTYTDGDSISVREALALKVPVVASDTAYRPEGVLRFVKGDADDFVQKLRQVLEGRGPSQKSGIGDGRENATRLLNIYEELNRKSGTAARLQRANTKGVNQ